MKKASLAIGNTAQTPAKGVRRVNWLIDAEPYSRSTSSAIGSDDLKLKAALRRAVERDLAPQILIDSIMEKIRNT